MRKSFPVLAVVLVLLAGLTCLYGLTAYLGIQPRVRATQAVRAAAEAARISTATLPPQAPPASKGYPDGASVVEALKTGALTLVDLEVATPPDVIESRDLEYGRVGECSLRLDLYQPAWRSGRTVPGLVFVHGGAWSSGSRQSYRRHAVRQARRGYVAASISYRLPDEAPFPAAIEDVRSAVRWLRVRAPEYGLDPGAIGVVGSSAGGYLAMMTGYAADVPEFDGAGGATNVSGAVAVVVTFSGTFDLGADRVRELPAVRRFIGDRSPQDVAAVYRQASPSTHLRAGAPPTLVMHGTIDELVPVTQADALARRLLELGVPFAYDRLEGWPHAFDLAEAVRPRCEFMVDWFLDRHLPLRR